MRGLVASPRVSRLLTVVPLLGCGANFAHAAEQAQGVSGVPLREVQITATRLSAAIDYVPASLMVIHGEDLRRLGASDLRTALATVAGVDAPPGGDSGPAGSVPSLWGLHEFDAFLLVVDGVPWGGAFNPAIPALDLNDVERIEIMKGAAPVMFGATSFVGVIHVIRYPAGESANELSIAGGSRSSAAGSLSTALPLIGSYRHSLLLDGARTRLTGRDQGFDRAHGLYRAAAPLLGGNGGVDVEYLAQTQLPTSPVLRERTSLTTRTALDGNFNPADSAIVEHRTHLAMSFDRALRYGEWRMLLSYTSSTTHDVRGFLRRQLAIGADGNNADGFNQDRRVRELYFDSFVSIPLSGSLSLTTGLDWLSGDGTQQSRNFAYVAPLDGGVTPSPSTSRHVDEINGLDDRREFGGLYAQLDWNPHDRFGVLGGLRLNDTHEHRVATHADTIDRANDRYFTDSHNHLRVSGDLGATLRIWGAAEGPQRGILFAQYCNTFKPAAIDFGPDVNATILHPENADGYQGGLRVKTLAGAVDWEIAAFKLNFANLVVNQTDASAAPVMVNAGRERFVGAETELRWHAMPGTVLTVAYSYHDTRFGNTMTIESGTPVQLDGHQLNLSPHNIAALGLQVSGFGGLQLATQAAYIGRRFLDRLNTAAAGGYVTVDARLGLRLRQYTIAVQGQNLTNRRDPVTASEFGDQSYYLLPARALMLSIAADLRG